MLDLAIVQLIAGILVTLGTTLLAISIGFGLSIPAEMQEAIFQLIVNRGNLSAELPQALVMQSLTNYVMILAGVGIALAIAGVTFASAKTNKLRKQIIKERNVSRLLATDVKAKSDSVADPLDYTVKPSREVSAG
jgi:hypothetical protein